MKKKNNFFVFSFTSTANGRPKYGRPISEKDDLVAQKNVYCQLH